MRKMIRELKAWTMEGQSFDPKEGELFLSTNTNWGILTKIVKEMKPGYLFGFACRTANADSEVAFIRNFGFKMLDSKEVDKYHTFFKFTI
jgi:hypothetical protein